MLKHRILTGGAFLALVAALYCWAPVWMLAAVVMLLTALAVVETVDLVRGAGFPALKWSCISLSILGLSSRWMEASGFEVFRPLTAVFPAFALWTICLGCLFRSDQRQTLGKLTGSFFTLAYIPALTQFILLLLLSAGPDGRDGRSLLLYGILVVKSTDMGAYFIGSACGRHKLIPSISPAKSWEGVLGGVGVAMGVSLLLLHLYGGQPSGVPLTRLDGLLLGALLAVAGVLGDLVESMLKRAAGVKDSGSWLKGLGGLLDVLDSLIFALPVLYLYLQLKGGGL